VSTNEKPSRILFITDNFPPVVGGVAQVARMLAQGMNPERVVVLAPKWPGSDSVDKKLSFPVYRIRSRDAGPEVERGPAGKTATFFHAINMFIWGLHHYVWRRCDLVVFPKIWPVAITGYLLGLFGVPYVAYAHGSDIIAPRGRVQSWFRKRFIENARGIIANSNFTRGYVLKYGVPKARTTVIYPRLDMSRFDKSIDVESFKDKERLAGKKILFIVARLYPNKGIQRVIEVLPEIVKEFPDLVYVVAGEGPYKESLQGVARSFGIADHVRFPGNRDIVAFFKACDIYIMTTLWDEEKTYLESFGIAFLEANYCKKPCISGVCGGMPEAVLHEVTGLNANPDRRDRLKEAILRLLRDPGYARKLGEQGHQRVMREFTYQKAGQELDAFLTTLKRAT